MKIGITTANGHLGAKIIQQLLKQEAKHELIGFARTPEKAEFLGIEIRKGDFDQPADFEKGLKGIDVLMLITGMDPPGKRSVQHKNIIDAAVKNGVRKIVFTSIIGSPEVSGFAPIVRSSRDTEKMLKESKLQWIAGRNGLYIEPDLEAVKSYAKEGKISNSAGDGKCSYTDRDELAIAYARLLTDDSFNNRTYNLCAEGITQNELCEFINEAFHTKLSYEPLDIKEFTTGRVKAHGEFLGGVIGGIYESIQLGAFEVIPDFDQITGREHKSIREIIREYAEKASPIL